MERAAAQGDPFAVHGLVTPLIGRDRELATLRGLLERAVSYQAPQVVTIIGNQGTGKSRLVSEWAGGVTGQPARIFRGRASAPGHRYSAIARLLRDRFGLADGDESEEAKNKFRDTVQVVFGDRRVGEVVHFLGDFLGFRYADSPFLRAFEDNPRQHDQIGRAVLRRFLEVDAAVSPLVLILDDLSAADDDTLTLIDELGEGLGGSPVMVVACARPDLVVRRPSLGQTAMDHTRIDLKNLEPALAAQMFKSLLSRCDGVTQDLVLDAVEMTGGNPFFMEELVRLMIANGTITTGTAVGKAGGRWRIDPDRAAETELPISVEEAIEARISALDRGERELLEKGAIFGNVFWISAVVAMTRMDQAVARGKEADQDKGGRPPPLPVGVDDGLGASIAKRVDELVERDYLLRLPPEDSTIPNDVEIVFKHNLERDLVARQTDAERRRRYHLIAAQWLETKLADRSEEQLEFLAQLYERGGAPRRAAQCYIAGGDKARGRYANQQAVEFYQRGLAMLDYDDCLIRLEALHNLGDVLALVGRTDEAAGQFQEMLRTAWLLDHTAKAGAAHDRIGRLHRQRGDYDHALEHFRDAHELFERAGDLRGVAGALGDTGTVHWLRGAYPTALEHHRRALDIRRQLGDKRSIAHSLASIGRVYHDSGAFQQAIEQLREALELRRQIGDRPGTISSLVDLGAVHEADGKLDAAHEIFTEALKLAREIGDRLAQGDILSRLGEVELQLGRTREAAEHLGQALETAVALGDRLGQAECARRLAEVCLTLSDPLRAYEHARRALELAQKIGSRVHVGVAHRVMGEVVATAADPERQRAEEQFRAAVTILGECKNELELARCYRAYAAFRERSGLHADAARLRTRADEIFGRLRGAAQS